MAEKNLSHAAVERVIKSIEFRNFLSSNMASLLSGDACHCRVCLAISYDTPCATTSLREINMILAPKKCVGNAFACINGSSCRASILTPNTPFGVVRRCFRAFR